MKSVLKAGRAESTGQKSQSRLESHTWEILQMQSRKMCGKQWDQKRMYMDDKD